MKKYSLKLLVSLVLLSICGLLYLTGMRFYGFLQQNFFNISDSTAILAEYKQQPNIDKIEKDTSSDSNDNSKTSDTDTDMAVLYNKLLEEDAFPVIESKFTASGTNYENFYVKNSTNQTLNVKQLLKSKLGFEFENNDNIQVLIIHTHSCESYLDYDLGYYFEDYYPRNTDNNYNVTKVGDAIVKKLAENGIGAIADKTHHDYPSYNGSYDRSRATIEKYLKKYPSIKVILDIHRDALGNGGSDGKIKPTFVYDGKKAAQIMIMSGCDEYQMNDFPFWNENLKFALKLQSKAETMYPGMTRPLYFGNFVYNMNINTGSLLIEVGTDVNTLDEAVYSGELLGNVLSQVLIENMS